MTDLTMMRAALFNLSVAIEGIEDSFLQSQIRLASNVLAGAIDNAGEHVTPAGAGDIEFALNDLVATAGELSAPDAERVMPFIEQLETDVAALTSGAALAPDVVERIHMLILKLKSRRKAIERQTFVEGGGDALPHDPSELREDALPIRARLSEAGFATPALDALIDDPGSLRLHGIIAIVDELEVITD